MHYFSRSGDGVFTPTEHVGGAWALDEQHISPLLGLLAALVEKDLEARRSDDAGDLALSRVAYEILGTIRVEPFEVRTSVVRPGRTIELVEAVASQDGRDVVILRAWFMRRIDSSAIAGVVLPGIPPREEIPPASLPELWPGGFIASITEARRRVEETGHSVAWVRPTVALLAGEECGTTAMFCAFLDLSNGLATRVTPDVAAFPNVDLSAYFLRHPRGEWIGYEVRQSYGAEGVGLTEAVLHDVDGPVGTISQLLTVRPR